MTAKYWLIAIPFLTVPLAAAGPAQDQCLFVAAENIVKGEGNWFVYVQFSDAAYSIQNGDRLEYDVYLPTAPAPLNAALKGGVDADLKNENLPAIATGKPWIRDCGIKDQNGVKLHGDGLLDRAKDQWYHREFDLSPLAGAKTTRWSIVFEGDLPGQYVQLLDNIRVTRDGKTVLSLYENGPAPQIKLRQTEGFSRTVFVNAAPREDKFTESKVRACVESARDRVKMNSARDEFKAEIEVARQLAAALKDEKLVADIAAAERESDDKAFEAGEFDAYLESLHKARHKLGHAHPQMQKFTGHLVGHAHIDLQWLWSWQESIDKIIPETFGQAVKFMREYKDFTFSQSSPCLYLAAEQNHPQIFKDIQEMVAKGQWEIVGGRWCEGDTNMISPESHVRHLLYGQRYFQQKFGRIASVGWEPDTFGHCWTLPQILRKAGIDSYYFCRAGKNVPLFWWESPDGSRVLAFEEPATGGWYNDVVDDEKVRELAKFVSGAGSLDHLMVYGVGNHGGGPTREYIEAALKMRERGLWPTIKFSTAGEFFKRLHAMASELKAPTIRDELNPVFEGCYTTHSRIKKYNRDSESLLESAEVWSVLARIRSEWRKNPDTSKPIEYPRADFESMWRDVCWNHHHDTLPGSFIHPSAEFSYKMYDALEKRVTSIIDRSRGYIVHAVGRQDRTVYVVVSNPLAWTRTEVVEATIRLAPSDRMTTLFDADGNVPTQVIDRKVENDAVVYRVAFLARGVPGCGTKELMLRGPAGKDLDPITEANVSELIPLDPRRRQLPKSPGPWPKPQLLVEKPHGMSAWTIGDYSSTTDLVSPPGSSFIMENGDVRCRTRVTYMIDKLRLDQDWVHYPDLAASAGSGPVRVDYESRIDWRFVGNSKDGSQMLKVAFDTGLKADSAVYDIPFGDITRKNDGHEYPALKWCAVTGTDADGKTRTVAIMNDCKHGYDVKDGVIRLTLLRSSYDPDPKPDVGEHNMRYAVVSMDGPLDKAAIVRAAWEFNKPMHVDVIGDGIGGHMDQGSERSGDQGTARATGDGAVADPPPRSKISMDVPPTVDAQVSKTAPAIQNPKSKIQNMEWSGLSAEPANIIVTALKMAEDNDDLIVRAYECAGNAATATLTFGFDFKSATENDLLEREASFGPPPSVQDRVLTAEFKPHEIRTFRVKR